MTITQPSKLPFLEFLGWQIADVYRLTQLEMLASFTSKLLANADRYADHSVYSRDLIDLAFLRNSTPIPSVAIEKAEAAYRVMPPLNAALTKFQADADLRFHCYENLTISECFCSQLIDGIDLLAVDLGLDKTSRTITESGDDIFRLCERVSKNFDFG